MSAGGLAPRRRRNAIGDLRPLVEVPAEAMQPVMEHGGVASASSVRSVQRLHSSRRVSQPIQRPLSRMGGGGMMGHGGNMQRPHSAVGPMSNQLAQQQVRPWMSPAVLTLSKRAGSRGSLADQTEIQPMVVEGPAGVVIQAVGEQVDHEVAGKALATCQQQRIHRERLAIEHGGGNLAASSKGSHKPTQRRASSASVRQNRSLARRGNAVGDTFSFGAVYEHYDSFGKPRLVASTIILPEIAFRQDAIAHTSVAALIGRGDDHGQGKRKGDSKVVWAGVGRRSAGLGNAEMNEVREAVATARASRLQLDKLQSPKPYSKHGY